MSISNLGELKTHIASTAHRADTTFTALVPTWLQLAEADINARMGESYSLADGGATASNWLLDHQPNAYLYGALFQYAVWAQDAAMAQGYLSLYVAAVEAAMDRKFTEGGGSEDTMETEFPLRRYAYNILTG